MVTFLGIIHIIVAILLILLVLIQDSKGGMGALGGGGGGSNTVLGAAGAENILAKMTRYVAIIFACTCVMLTINASNSNTKSVVEGFVPAAAPQKVEAPAAGATDAAPKADEQKQNSGDN